MQVDLLGLLMLQPEREWRLEQLAKILKATPSSVHRELNRAVAAGLVTRSDDRRPHMFRAAQDSPIYPSIRELLDRTVGVPERFRRALQGFNDVRVAVIHGSWAGGQVRPTSDVDLLVIAEGDRRAIRRAVRQVGRDVGREVDASVLTPEAFRELKREDNPFLAAIIRGPHLAVVGDLAEFVDAA